jgi:hypothetical protein
MQRVVGPCLAVATLVFCSCGKKPEAAAPPPAAPAAVTIDSEPAPVPEAPPPAPVAAAQAPGEPAKEPPKDEDPVTKLQREELEFMNRGLRAFIAKFQRLPKDFNELARNIDGVPLPPIGQYWAIDEASKSIKLRKK